MLTRAETVRAEDFRGLRHLANRLGDRFRAGIVLYAGEQQLSFGDLLTALPMAALWTLDGSVSGGFRNTAHSEWMLLLPMRLERSMARCTRPQSAPRRRR